MSQRIDREGFPDRGGGYWRTPVQVEVDGCQPSGEGAGGVECPENGKGGDGGWQYCSCRVVRRGGTRDAKGCMVPSIFAVGVDGG